MVLKIIFSWVFKAFFLRMAIEKSAVILNPNNLYVTCFVFFCGKFWDFPHYPGGLNFMRKYLGLDLSYFFFFLINCPGPSEVTFKLDSYSSLMKIFCIISLIIFLLIFSILSFWIIYYSNIKIIKPIFDFSHLFSPFTFLFYFLRYFFDFIFQPVFWCFFSLFQVSCFIF